MKVYLKLTQEEVYRKIPYQLIAETTSRSIWNTGKRKWLYIAAFTAQERERLVKLRRQANIWALVKGVPTDGVMMTAATYNLWQRFGEFCGGL